MLGPTAWLFFRWVVLRIIYENIKLHVIFMQILLCNVRLVLTIKAIMVDVSQRGYSTAKTPIGMYPCQDLVGSGGEGEALSLQVNIDLPHFSKFLSG